MPIATRYPPSNVTFEMHDIAEKFRYDPGSIDFVHARSISMAVRPFSLIECGGRGTLTPELRRSVTMAGFSRR